MLKRACGLALVLALTVPAHAENWVKVHGNLFVDAESLFTDSGGYTLFKTRELTASGSVQHQHKEAIHCANSRHYFRSMYGANDRIDNRNDADIKWTDWKQNPREVYNIDRLYALKTAVCKMKK